jgi:hypothetical protein
MRYPLSSAVLETLVPRHRLRASMHGYSTVYRVYTCMIRYTLLRTYYLVNCIMYKTCIINIHTYIIYIDIISYPLFSFDF